MGKFNYVFRRARKTTGINFRLRFASGETESQSLIRYESIIHEQTNVSVLFEGAFI